MVGNSSTYNTANMFIALKTREQGRKSGADQVIARLRPQLTQVEGASLLMQAGQDINIGGRLARTQYQYTLSDADLGELNVWAPRLLARFMQLPQLADVASDLQNAANTTTLTIDRDRAGPASASCRRRSTRRSTTPLASAKWPSTSRRSTATTRCWR